MFGVPPEKLYPNLSADLCKSLMRGQRPVAWMDCINIADLSRGDDGGNVQVGFAGWGWPDANILIGKANVERVAVGLTVWDDGDV